MAITLRVTDYSGGSRVGVGGSPPNLFLEHSEARRAEKFGDAPPHPPTYLKDWIRTGLCSLNLHSFVVGSHIGCASTAKFGKYILSIPS